MKKIRLTESDLVRIIERVIKEDDFFLNDIGKVTPTGNPSKSKYEGGKVTRATKFPDRFMDKDDREVEFNPEGKSSSIYTSLEKFGKDHPELYGKYFGNFAKGGENRFYDYGGEFEVFDEEAKLEEMKKRVKVMENNLRRKKQLRRR